MIAKEVKAGDVMVIARVVSINPYRVDENRVTVKGVETFADRVRIYHGKTSLTCHPDQDIVLWRMP